MDCDAESSRPEKSGLVIQAGHNVLLKLPNGEFKSAKFDKNSTVSLGRFGTFNSSLLIGQPYGLSYEIAGPSLNVLPPKLMQDIEDTDATNELINDEFSVQPLTAVEIEELKQAGLHASEIIQRQIDQHANYALKTEYSKEKYKKRKEAKFSKKFSTVEPTIYNITEYWFMKDRSRIRELRTDSLAQMMSLGNVHPGGRYIVVDDASGLLVASMLDRLRGNGRIIGICDVESPPAYPIISHMNFEEEILSPVLSSLNWATADEEYTPIVPPSMPETGVFRSDRQKSRLDKRKAVNENLSKTREELFAGEFDGLLVASLYEPFSIIERLFPYLAGSANIVVHSPTMQVVADLQALLRPLPSYLGPTVTEGWLRRYQVLPGRTHPLMTVSGSGGYILHTIKVYDDPNASSVMAMRSRARRKPVSDNHDNSLPMESTDADEEPTAVKMEEIDL